MVEGPEPGYGPPDSVVYGPVKDAAEVLVVAKLETGLSCREAHVLHGGGDADSRGGYKLGDQEGWSVGNGDLGTSHRQDGVGADQGADLDGSLLDEDHRLKSASSDRGTDWAERSWARGPKP